jgi:hypothetical protein
MSKEFTSHARYIKFPAETLLLEDGLHKRSLQSIIIIIIIIIII